MEIQQKYLNLLRKYIYHKRLDKFGMITEICITCGHFGYGIALKVFCDEFDSDVIVYFEDFEKNNIVFTIITGYGELDKQNEDTIKEIKEAFGDKYSESMIMYIDKDERSRRIDEEKKRNTQKLHTDLVSLSDISVEVFADDFYSKELYLKYKDNVIGKEQLLYALINHIFQEYKRVKDENLEYFDKYVLSEKIKQMGEN